MFDVWFHSGGKVTEKKDDFDYGLHFLCSLNTCIPKTDTGHYRE